MVHQGFVHCQSVEELTNTLWIRCEQIIADHERTKELSPLLSIYPSISQSFHLSIYFLFFLYQCTNALRSLQSSDQTPLIQVKTHGFLQVLWRWGLQTVGTLSAHAQPPTNCSSKLYKEFWPITQNSDRMLPVFTHLAPMVPYLFRIQLEINHIPSMTIHQCCSQQQNSWACLQWPPTKRCAC